MLSKILLASGLSPHFTPLTFLISCPEPSKVSDVRIPPKNEFAAEAKAAVRSLLRFGGHKPSGRGRPASESLLKALNEDKFPVIHPVVDFFNGLSVLSALPISVFDFGLLQGGLEFRLGGPAESYVFNPSGQELSLKGLLLLADEFGPVGTPVKDAQRTKVSQQTEQFLVVIWATNELKEAKLLVTQEVDRWLRNNNLSSS